MPHMLCLCWQDSWGAEVKQVVLELQEVSRVVFDVVAVDRGGTAVTIRSRKIEEDWF